MSRKEQIETLSAEFKNKYNVKMKGMTMELPDSKAVYGDINILKIELEKTDELPLIMIPGYSYRSFQDMARVLMTGYDHLKIKYSCIYMVCWTDEIKALTSSTSDYDKQEEYRLAVTNILNKILHKLEISKCSVVGKSAGGGVSIYLTSMNSDIQYLYLACPGITPRAKPLAARQIPIKLMWCKDDDTLPYTMYKEFLSDFDDQKKEYSFHSYNTGGHELNTQFIYEL